MRKKRIIIGLIAIIIAIVICAFIMKYFKDRNNANEIVLSTNSGFSYKWECNIDDKKIASIKKSSSKQAEELEGGEVLITFTVYGKKEGTTLVSCNYINPNTNSSIDSSSYIINVDKDLNVTIQNSD